jgi:hypothetical protein
MNNAEARYNDMDQKDNAERKIEGVLTFMGVASLDAKAGVPCVC